MIMNILWSLILMTHSIDQSCTYHTQNLPTALQESSGGFSSSANKIYLMGGYDGSNFENDIYRWNVATNEWLINIGNTPTTTWKTFGAQSTVFIDDIVYFVGIQDLSASPYTTDHGIYRFNTTVYIAVIWQIQIM